MNSTAAKPVRVMVVDDHPLVRAGIRSQIEREQDMMICAEAEDISDALRLLDAETPDVVIVDISLKSGNGLDLVQRILARQPALKIVVSSMHDEQIYAERALDLGAMAYIHKQNAAQTLVSAIREVVNGRLYASDAVKQRMLVRRVGRSSAESQNSAIQGLSHRELDVFERIGRGQTVQQIASQMSISPKTVETHRDRIRQKLDIGSSHELQHFAINWVRDHIS